MAEFASLQPGLHDAELFRLLADQVKDHAIFLLDPAGLVMRWSKGAERLLGYTEAEIVGRSADCFFMPGDTGAGIPEQELRDALETGRSPDDHWQVRQDGTRFWCSAVLTPLWEDSGQLRGFAKIMRDLTEQKGKEDALRDALLYAESIVQTVREPLLVLSGDLLVRTANRSFYQTFHVVPEETEGRPLYQLGSGQWNIPRLRTLLEEVLPQSASFEGFEVECDFPALGRRVMVLNGRKLHREGSHSDLILLAIEDITARRETEIRLQTEEQKRLRQHRLFQTIADQAGEALFLMDSQGRITLMNPAAQRMFGWCQEEIGDKTLHELLHDRRPDGTPFPHSECPLCHVMTDGPGRHHHEDIFYHKDGRAVPVYCSNATVRDGDRVTGAVLVANDITEQKQAEAQREMERARLEAILRQMPAGVLIVEAPSGKLLLCNQQYVEILCQPMVPEQRVCADGRSRGFHPDGKPYAPDELPLARSLATGEVVKGEEIEFMCGDGVRRVIQVSSAPVRNQHGEVVAVVAAFFDLTEQKRTRQLLQEQAAALRDADRRKDEFLAMLAHELRNPLAPMATALHIIMRSQSEFPSLRRAVQTIDRQIAQMGRLVEDLLDVSRITRGKIQLQKEDLDLETIVEQATETVHHHISARRHRLHVDCTHLPIRGDPARLQQIVGNLLNNAAKYTPEGGDIWVELKREGQQAILRVRDTGLGIAPEMLRRIFDLFVQENRLSRHGSGGLGIGLTLVKSLVELHGGTVEAQSEGFGKGTTFEVRLPIVRPSRPADGVRSNRNHGPNRPCVLVIDDNEDAANSLCELLRMEGYEAHIAYDGETGLQQIERLAPAVVLLDIGLPGIDGYEVARRIPKSRKPYLVAVTGFGQKADRRKGRAVGFDEHLVKPVRPECLLNLLSHLEIQADPG